MATDARRLPRGDRLAYSLRVLRSNTRSAIAALTFALGGLAACAGPERKFVAARDDGVPANSASEERLDGGPKPGPSATVEDSTSPRMTPMSAEGGANGPAPVGKTGKGGGAKVTKPECKQLFDKYIDLTIGSDSRFEGIPPEMIAQLKESALAQAQSEKGDPCSTQEVSRTQYACAIASTSTGAWERCMK